MIKIAVCDDDVNLCDYIKKVLLKRFTEIDVKSFNNISSFIEALEYESLDVIILDIVFENKDAGINIGNTIRNKYKNDYTQIIYISNYEKYAMDLFEIRPLNFLLKPIDKNKLCEAVAKALELCNYSGNILTFKAAKKTLRILYKDILYITKNNRKLLIVTKNKTYEEYGKMSDINVEFGSTKFIRIHSSIIINSLYVKAYYKSEVLMTNGEILPISRSYQKIIKTMLLEDDL